ncbi:MAG: CHAT domain-containing tetratricopeptide repeat protein [bacterium]
MEILKKTPGTERDQADCCKNIGASLIETGKYEEGIKYQNLALEMYKKTPGTERNQAGCHKNIGVASEELGRYEEGIKYQNLALEMYKKTPGTEKNQAGCHANIGAALEELGIYEEGIKHQNLALEMYKKMPGTERRQAGCYVNIGLASSGVGKYEEDIKYQNLALEMYKKMPGTERNQADCCKNIGLALSSMGKYEEDIKYQNLALETFKKTPGTKKEQDGCYQNIGDALRYAHKFDDAIQAYCLIPKERRSWLLSLGLAKAYEGKGNPWEASSNYIDAVNSAEEKREEALWNEARMGVFEEPSNVYSCFSRFLVSLSQKNMSLSRPELSLLASSKDPVKANLETAFYYSEAGKARTTLDLLQERNVLFREKAPSELFKEDLSLQKQIALLHGSKKEETGKKAQELQQRRDQIGAEIKKSLIGKYQRPEIKNAVEVQEKMPEDTAVLEYVVLPEETVLFVLTKNTLDAFRINIESRVPGEIIAQAKEAAANAPASAGLEAGKKKSSIGLEGLIRLYRQPMENPELSSSSRVYMEAGKFLADLLIPEGSRNLLKKTKHLLIIPDGVLCYLPFNALILGSNSGSLKPGDFSDCHYLVEDYAVSYVPSLALLDTVYLQAEERAKERPPEGKKLAAFADPVFDGTDPRLKVKTSAVEPSELLTGDEMFLCSYYKDRGLSFLRLPETKDESETIAGLFPEFIVRESPDASPSDKPSIVYAGLAATDIKAKSPEMKEYKYILFSTHGLVDALNPWLSCIALTDEKPAGERAPAFLKVEDFFSMDLDADLVTLSACQAPLGIVKGGEGMAGFSTALFYAGASSVCVSLWSAPPLAAKAIMADFYKGIAEGKTGKAEALRRAQLKLLRSDKKYAHPFFWAAFMLLGDYK